MTGTCTSAFAVAWFADWWWPVIVVVLGLAIEFALVYRDAIRRHIVRLSSVARAGQRANSGSAVLMARERRVNTYSVPVVLLGLGLVPIVLGKCFPNELISLSVPLSR